ncbi:MAG: BREX system ATP-binding domain-containing protein [Candidatus Eremiobacterota bacterium]
MWHNNGNILLKNALEHIATFGTAPSGTSHLVDVGTERYLKYFEKEIIDDLVSKGGATCKFFEGAYGSGKTHILEMLRELAFKKNLVVANTNLSQALSLSDWRLITEYIFQNMEALIDGQIVRSLPEILALWGRKNITSHIDILKKENLPCPGFKYAMIYATQKDKISPELWPFIEEYLSGRKVSNSDLKKHGLGKIKNCLNRRNAEYVLKTVLQGLYCLGFNGTILLFDENEKTLSVDKRGPSRKNNIAANLMRRMIDGCVNGLMAGTVSVFAVLPGFLENCSMSYQALGQRLQIFRDETYRPSWRWPVLPVDFLNEITEEEDFLEHSINKYISIVEKLGGKNNGICSLMKESGQSVLLDNAGSGYKRILMKTLSNIALQSLGEG